MVLEFAAIGDRLTGDALLVEHAGAIGLLHSALESLQSPYARSWCRSSATLPQLDAQIAEADGGHRHPRPAG